MTLNEVFPHFVKWKSMLVKESTLAAYVLKYKVHLQPAFGDMDLMEMDKKTIRSWILDKMAGGLSKKSMSDMLVVIRMMMQFATDELDAQTANIGWKMVWPTKNADEVQKINRYTPAEIKQIIKYIEDHPSPRNFGVTLCLCTGMRIGELCGLQWKDFDPDTKTITVNKTVERIYDILTNTTKIVIQSPKTINSRRTIPIMPSLLPMMKAYSKISNPDYYILTCSEKPEEPRHYRSYYTDLILNKVKISHCIRFHGMRHSFASQLIENGVDPKTVSSILGHSDVSTTLNLYVHPSEDQKRNAINSTLKKLIKV